MGGVTESHVPSGGIYKQLLSQWEGSSLQYVGFYSNNWGPNPAPERAMTATEQIGFAQQPVHALITTTQNTPLPRRQWPDKDKAGIHIKNSPHTKNFEPTQSAQGHMHIQTAFKTQ